MTTFESLSPDTMTDEARAERAKKSVAAFRRMQPMLNSYARAFTGNKRMRVEISATIKAATDGNKIYFCPPIALGDDLKHVKSLCDKRDPETLLQQCEACLTKEAILVTIYHEIAHVCYGTFATPTEQAGAELLDRVLTETPGKFAERAKKMLKAAPPYMTDNYMGMSSLISPYLKIILNALEDARVNNSLFAARRGTKVMFDAASKQIFERGIEIVDAKTGEVSYAKWNERELNLQAILAVYCEAADYDYADWFVPQVVEALTDTELLGYIESSRAARTVAENYGLSFLILKRLRELGFCRSDQDADPEPEPPVPPQSDEQDEDGKPSSNPGDDDNQDDEPQGEGEGDGGTASDEDPESGGTGTDDGDDTGEAGDDSGDGGGAESDDTDSEESTGDSSETEADDTGDQSGDEPADDVAGDQDGSSSDDSGTDDEGLGDDSDQSDVAESGEGEQSDEESGEPGESRDGTDSDGDARDQSGEPGDTDSDEFDAGSSSVRDGDVTENPESDETDEVESDDTGDIDEPDESEWKEDDEDTEAGGAEGMVPEDAVDLTDQSDLPYGEPDEVEKGLEQFGGHDHDSDEPSYEQMLDVEALKKAILQGMYFETASENVVGVREHFHGTPFLNSKGQDTSTAWTGRHFRRHYSPKEMGMTGDFKPAEVTIGKPLLKLRTVLESNARSHNQAHLKSGRVNGRVLGKRAPLGDERLFRKKIVPGKRDYFVIIGLDISGSTLGQNLQLIKAAAWAQAELLSRMGIKFVMCAFTAAFDDPSTLTGVEMYVDMYQIKGENEPWNKTTQERLQMIGPDGGNLDGHNLEYFRKICDRSTATDKIIMYYSDGRMPASNYSEEREILQREIETCKKKGYTLCGVGIRTDSPKEHGLPTVQVDSKDDIMNVVKFLEVQLRTK